MRTAYIVFVGSYPVAVTIDDRDWAMDIVASKKVDFPLDEISIVGVPIYETI